MRYYEYDPDSDNFAGIGVPDLPDGEDVAKIRWQDWPRTPSWTPLAIMDVYDVEDGRKKELGDFPALSNLCTIPVFSGRAWEILSGQVACDWEALPLIHPKGLPLYLIHVMETIDCVDLERSEIWRLPSGRVGEIERFSLRREKLEDKHIFKTPTESGAYLLFDDVFRDIVLQNGLRGLAFREIPMVRSPGTQRR
jgi:hypothetical protein